jgi:hypothetical protein
VRLAYAMRTDQTQASRCNWKRLREPANGFDRIDETFVRIHFEVVERALPIARRIRASSSSREVNPPASTDTAPRGERRFHQRASNRCRRKRCTSLVVVDRSRVRNRNHVHCRTKARWIQSLARRRGAAALPSGASLEPQALISSNNSEAPRRLSIGAAFPWHAIRSVGCARARGSGARPPPATYVAHRRDRARSAVGRRRAP